MPTDAPRNTRSSFRSSGTSVDYLDPLAELTSAGLGEVEVHLHHDRDTPERLRGELSRFIGTLSTRHGLLSRDPDGATRYAFIHGNWALDNSSPDGRWCGVNNEIQILIDTGCYVDMTMPAAPNPAQTRTVNAIYYATDDPDAAKSHDKGVPSAVGVPPPQNALLLLQGPLLLGWKRTRRGIWPRLENSSLHAGDPPTPTRMREWVRCGISVAGRPEWVFVKLHTHGAPEGNAGMLLGPEMRDFHRHLASSFNDGSRFRLHYVTAREMANIVHAAEAGESGDPGKFRDYRLGPPPRRKAAAPVGVPR